MFNRYLSKCDNDNNNNNNNTQFLLVLFNANSRYLLTVA